MGSRDYKILSPESRDWENQSGIAVHTGHVCRRRSKLRVMDQHRRLSSAPLTRYKYDAVWHDALCQLSLLLRTNSWQVEKRNPPPKKTIMLRNSGKQSGESVESVLKKIKGYGRKDLQKRMVLSLECLQWWMLTVMSGYSVEERVPVMADWLQLT